MQWNHEKGIDFPVALAQDFLDGTGKALTVLGWGVPKIGKARGVISCLLLSSEEIARSAQVMSTQHWIKIAMQPEFYSQELFQGYSKSQE